MSEKTLTTPSFYRAGYASLVVREHKVQNKANRHQHNGRRAHGEAAQHQPKGEHRGADYQAEHHIIDAEKLQSKANVAQQLQ